MAVIISMLRGVNLGKRRVKMEALRALYESLGLRDAQTLVQSGNVVFRTEQKGLAALAKKIESAVEREFGFHSDVILRSVSEVHEVIKRNPLAKRSDLEPNKFLVWFLVSDPGEEIRKRVRAVNTEPEEVHIDGREVYIYFPNGMARPKMKWAAIENILAVRGTGRNWNTVKKLLKMAEKLEAAG
jgi:uncharacterized protein (DUF1697 family)